MGVSSSWTCVVAAEMIAASSGIGFLISYGREMAQPATLFIGVFSMGLFGLIIEILVIICRKRQFIGCQMENDRRTLWV